MGKVKPCVVCGKITARLLFNDKGLGVPICSRKCEYEYLNTLTLNMREQTNILCYLDDKIEATKRHEKIGWVTAGFGLLIVAIGLLSTNAAMFFVGVFPLTCGALSTTHFEDKRNKLVRMRKRILI